MWRLWHRLFGWEYVAIRYGFSDQILRVRRSAEGDPICFFLDQTFHLQPLATNFGDRRYIAVAGGGQIYIWLPLTRGIVPDPEAVACAKPEGLLAARLARVR
jgi:hypothetical protein